MIPAEENALKIENKKLQQQTELMKQLNSTSGFFDYFFKKIPEFETRKNCFDAVNEKYFELFGRYRYSDYSVFRNIISRNYKNKP